MESHYLYQAVSYLVSKKHLAWHICTSSQQKLCCCKERCPSGEANRVVRVLFQLWQRGCRWPQPSGTWGEVLPQSWGGGRGAAWGTRLLCCSCHRCMVASALSSAGCVPEAPSPPAEMGFTDSSGLKLTPQRTDLEPEIAVLNARDIKYVITNNEDEVTDKQYGTVMISHTHFLYVPLWVLYFF